MKKPRQTVSKTVIPGHAKCHTFTYIYSILNLHNKLMYDAPIQQRMGKKGLNLYNFYLTVAHVIKKKNNNTIYYQE